MLNRQGKLSLHSLRVLSLKFVTLSEELLNDFVGNAPNLESLSLEKCFPFERLEVSATNFPKLKTLSIQVQDGSEFELQLTAAPFLESLVVEESGKPCKLRIVSSAPKLKSLTIKCGYRIFTRLDLDDLIMKLPSLQSLSVTRLCLRDQLLCTLMANAPNLRSLRFSSFFYGIKRLEVSHGKLSNLEMIPIGSRRTGKTEFEIQLTSTPCLKALSIKDILGMCKLSTESPSAAPNLKLLELSLPKGFTQSHLDDLISKFPSLESLHLAMVNGRKGEMSKLRVSSNQLRVFRLDDRNRPRIESLQELELDAHNLASVQYSGNGFRFPGEINVVNVASGCRFTVEGYDESLDRPRLTYQWFLGLRQSLSKLGRFHLDLRLRDVDLSQQVPSNFSQAECTSPPVIVRNLQLEITLSKSPDVQHCVTFLDELFWACHPQFICITQCTEEYLRFAEVVHKQLKNKDVANFCVDAKCWRHQLKDVKIDDTIQDDSNKMKTSKNDVSPFAKHAKVSFTLTWC